MKSKCLPIDYMEELFELTMINVCDEINDSNIVNIISNIKTQHTECMKKSDFTNTAILWNDRF